MDMKSLNPYQHFGLRQAWMEHFMSEGIGCFSMQVLGNRQYEALRVWLKESGIIETNKKDKSITVTPLGDKLIKMGPYNPLMWSLVWANLAYNSTICRWYCMHAEIGASKSSRENAVTELAETLRFSPLGDAFKQGIAIELSKSTFSYLRAGWDYPYAAALLYALYLYAEHSGRRSFTFTELVNAHSNPDAAGISPADIYGIDTKTFRDAVQALALQFPKYIRVSFVANLDNIILENYTSLDILELAEDE